MLTSHGRITELQARNIKPPLADAPETLEGVEVKSPTESCSIKLCVRGQLQLSNNRHTNIQTWTG